MGQLILPEHYHSALNIKQTEKAIKLIKDFFQTGLSTELNLSRVTAPIFVMKGLGINDDLNGIERPVSFKIKDMGDQEAEVVHSLAKWKRMALADYGYLHKFGIYTDMNAIRADEELDNIHSLYVDQWDWERVIAPHERNLDFLKEVVTRIYGLFKRLEFYVHDHYPQLPLELPEKITFIHSEDLARQFPDLSPKEREKTVCQAHGAVFIIGIGGDMGDGSIHDGRAPDYDDWSTPTTPGHHGLNGDILLWNPVLQNAFEVSSMGIRVDREALLRQLELRKCPERAKCYWHQRLLNGELPLSIGGGIGQSRLCMLFLKKAHIGEIQVGIWPPDQVEACKRANIHLL